MKLLNEVKLFVNNFVTPQTYTDTGNALVNAVGVYTLIALLAVIV